MSQPDTEQSYDDTKCYMCGRTLPDTSDPRDPAFDGYCDQDCVDGKTGIHTLFKLAELYGFDGEVQNAGKYLEKRLFKDTTCGVCFSVHKDISGVSVSGYVEGLDVECPMHSFPFPFHIDDFKAAVQVCDTEANEIWTEVEAEL